MDLDAIVHFSIYICNKIIDWCNLKLGITLLLVSNLHMKNYYFANIIYWKQNIKILLSNDCIKYFIGFIYLIIKNV